MERELSIHQQILKNLDGKKAYVKANGLRVEASIEGEVTLKFNENWGLEITASLQWNNVKIYNILSQEIVKMQMHDKSINLSFDDRDILLDKMKEIINSTNIHVATIYPYSINKIEVTTDGDKKDIRYVKIFYADSLIELNIKK